jgi:hypothetical protein
MTAAMDHDDTRTALAEVFGVPASLQMMLCLRLADAFRLP